MMLTPTEMERLVIYTAADLARKRRGRGLKLNHPEALALICDELLEAARDGKSLADVVAFGSTILTSDDVLPGVGAMLSMVVVEGMFEDGSKMITVWDPVRPGTESVSDFTPGEVLFGDGDIELNQGGDKITSRVLNTADRPIHVASHLHFFESNPALEFDRAASFGHRLDLPAGATARFNPGEVSEVTLTSIAGNGVIHGLNRLTEGSIHDPAVKDAALTRARELGFRGA